jgi:hypothetical protein
MEAEMGRESRRPRCGARGGGVVGFRRRGAREKRRRRRRDGDGERSGGHVMGRISGRWAGARRKLSTLQQNRYIRNAGLRDYLLRKKDYGMTWCWPIGANLFPSRDLRAILRLNLSR